MLLSTALSKVALGVLWTLHHLTVGQVGGQNESSSNDYFEDLMNVNLTHELLPPDPIRHHRGRHEAGTGHPTLEPTLEPTPAPHPAGGAYGEPDEQRLLRQILRGYQRAVRPVKNASETVIVKLGLTLISIFDMDEKNQVLTTTVWLDQEWYDDFFHWEPTEFNNLHVLRVPCDLIWLPDIVLYNNADDYTAGYMRSRAMVTWEGNVFWPPPTKLRSTCKVDVTYFPFDIQVCRLKFGSWTYDGFQVDLQNRSAEVDLSIYQENGEWELLKMAQKRNVVYYTCCLEPFPDIRFTLVMRRRLLYYMYNVVLPCLMMSSLTLLVFCLPPDSGEKIALGITVLLAFSVFMLAIAEKMPETSENMPLIGIYLTVVMGMTTLSVVMTVLVLNFHHRGPSLRPVPPWMKTWILGRLATVLRMRDDFAAVEQAAKDRADLYDEFGFTHIRPRPPPRPSTCCWAPRPGAFRAAWRRASTCLAHCCSDSDSDTGARRPDTRTPTPRTRRRATPTYRERHVTIECDNNKQNDCCLLARQKPAATDHKDRLKNCVKDGALPNSNTTYTNNHSANNSQQPQHKNTRTAASEQQENSELVASLRLLLAKQEREEQLMSVRTEWRQVAQVLDRVFFWLFLMATLGSALALLVIMPAANAKHLQNLDL